MAEPYSGETARARLRRMLLIRRTEEQVIHFALDHSGLIRGNYHVYIGQEAAGVGACAALRADDYVFTTHRNHGHVMARGGEPGPVLAEIIGRATGTNHGRGGTFHVSAPHLGILHTSAIVGASVPLATGAAFAIKQRGTDQVSLVFFGNGVLEEGVFHEAINMASLWKLPVVFVCENNDLPAVQGEAPEYTQDSLAAAQIVDVSRAFSIPSEVVDGSDVGAVEALTSQTIERVRGGRGPFFIEARMSRWPANPEASREAWGGDFDIAWAWSPEAASEFLHTWLRSHDPISRFARTLEQGGILTRGEIEDLDREVRAEAANAGNFALESPEPAPEAARDHVFA